MEFICRLFPSIFTIYIFFEFINKSDKKTPFKIANYYALSVAVNNLIVMSGLYIFLRKTQLDFSYILFDIKYLFISIIVALMLPFIYKYINNFIKTGVKKNEKFSLITLYKNNYDFLNRLFFISINIIIFYSLDLVIRYNAITVSSFNTLGAIGTNIFTVMYIFLFISLMYYLPKAISIIFSLIVYLSSISLFLTHYFLLKIKGEAFSIYELNNASEGAKYLNFMLKELNLKLIFYILFIATCIIISFILLKRIRKNGKPKFRYLKIIASIIVFIIGIKIAPYKLKYTDDDWQNVSFPKYYYLNMVNPKKSLTTMGLYEYTIKDYLNYLKIQNHTYGSIEDINAAFNMYKRNHTLNSYSGIFKGKNLIMIMMESVDYAAITESSTPTLYKMMHEGWTFPNRYSALSTGGSTILTEYTSLTGLIYNTMYYDKIMSNNYDYSLPNMFNRNGYITSSFHENNGQYYNREKLHSAIGFENKYFLFDMYDERDWDCTKDIKENTAYEYCDSQFANNKEIYNKLVNKEKKFMSFIVTISAHGPYDNSNGLCYDLNNNQLNCLKRLAGRTDDLLTDLIDNLEKDDLLDDTVIVLYTDHQAYSLDYPKKYLKSLKKIDDNGSIKALPLVIYTKDINKKSFDNILVNDIDLVPTIFNLFDIDYNANNYVGNDLFDHNRNNILMFSDGTWYDGKNYSESSTVDRDSQNYIDNSTYVHDILDLNTMIISNNYYSSINNKLNNN